MRKGETPMETTRRARRTSGGGSASTACDLAESHGRVTATGAIPHFQTRGYANMSCTAMGAVMIQQNMKSLQQKTVTAAALASAPAQAAKLLGRPAGVPVCGKCRIITDPGGIWGRASGCCIGGRQPRSDSGRSSLSREGLEGGRCAVRLDGCSALVVAIPRLRRWSEHC